MFWDVLLVLGFVINKACLIHVPSQTSFTTPPEILLKLTLYRMVEVQTRFWNAERCP